MSKQKKAFIFDTNFIIQNKELDKVIENLNEEYSVYVTQVSIDERIAQYCRDSASKYAEVEKIRQDTKRFAEIKFKKSLEQEYEYWQTGVQSSYERYFGKHIIPFNKNENTLTEVINRANRKLPPFSDAKDASDKGFKDCLLWLSLLEYFKTNGEDEVLFVTNDNGFRNNIDKLVDEFLAVTNKKLQIKDNSYYNELLKKPEPPLLTEDNETLPDFSKLRNRVNEVVENLRCYVSENYFGDEEWNETFIIQKEADSQYMEAVFGQLKGIIKEHVFEESIFASTILDLDGRIINQAEIPMENVENALHLYEDIQKKHPDYLNQFYGAAAKIINRSYEAPPFSLDDSDDDTPF